MPPGVALTAACSWQSLRRGVPKRIARPDYAEHGEPYSERRGREHMQELNAEEIERMRFVCKVG